MSYSYKCYSDTKDIMKKYVNAVEGAAIYGLGKTRIMALAEEFTALCNLGIFLAKVSANGVFLGAYM